MPLANHHAPLQGVILDMDGVLVDSEPFLFESAVRMFAEKGVTARSDDFRPFIGTGENHLLGAVAEKYGVTLKMPDDKMRTYAIYLQLIQGRLQALPGVFTFLDECRRRGLKLAIASSADAVKVEGNLHAIGLPPARFDVLVNGSEVERKKPAPDIFLAAVSRLGLTSEACMVVEDAVAGVAAARAAGCRCLALTTSFPADRLTEADWIAPDLSAVPSGVWT